MSLGHVTAGRRLAIAATAVALLVASGCWRPLDKWERQRPKTYKVLGQVLWDGKPEPGVFVTFESKSSSLTAGDVTDSSGRFNLKTYKAGDGAVAGEHGVRLQKFVMFLPENASPGAPPTEVLVSPKKYGDTATSGLTATVVEKGPNNFTFEITGPRAAP